MGKVIMVCPVAHDRKDRLLGTVWCGESPRCLEHRGGWVVLKRTTMFVYTDSAFEYDEQTTVKEAAGDCEITTTNDQWGGPFPEYDRYGHPTGCSVVRCTSYGREILSGRKEFATHRDGCEFEGQ